MNRRFFLKSLVALGLGLALPRKAKPGVTDTANICNTIILPEIGGYQVTVFNHGKTPLLVIGPHGSTVQKPGAVRGYWTGRPLRLFPKVS